MTKEEAVGILFSALSEGADIQRLVDRAKEKIFGNPIMVVNESFRILALSSEEEEIEDKVWQEAKEYRGFSREIIETFRNDVESKKLFVDRMAFIYSTGLGAKIPRILAPIDNGERLLGYLIIFEISHAINEKDLELSGVLCEAVKILILQRSPDYDMELGLTDYTLKVLLDGTGRPGWDMGQFNVKKEFMTLSVALFKNRKAKHYIEYLKNEIRSLGRTVYCFIYQDSLFVLLNYDTNGELRKFRESINRVLKGYAVCVGVSNPFAELESLSVYYRQAADVRKIGRRLEPGKMFYQYSDYREELLVHKLSGEQRQAMLTKEYRELRAYDQVHESKLLPTLYTWYYSSFNITETAEKLYLHRNTVTYRINKVKETLRVEELDMKTLEGIIYSYRIERTP